MIAQGLYCLNIVIIFSWTIPLPRIKNNLAHLFYDCLLLCGFRCHSRCRCRLTISKHFLLKLQSLRTVQLLAVSGEESQMEMLAISPEPFKPHWSVVEYVAIVQTWQKTLIKQFSRNKYSQSYASLRGYWRKPDMQCSLLLIGTPGHALSKRRSLNGMHNKSSLKF